MKLRFKTDAVVSGKVIYKAGEIHEVSNEFGSADRWIKRGAEVVLEEVKKEEIPVVVKDEEILEVDALDALGEEEVVIKDTKKENKAVKEKKPSKGK